MAGKARQLRQTALAAHAAAAAKIEHMQNEGREVGLLTLDLHGLHATEAVEAVARRWAFKLEFDQNRCGGSAVVCSDPTTRLVKPSPHPLDR